MSLNKFTKYSPLILSIALSSCVTNLNTKKVMGVKPGEKVKTVGRSKMVSGVISGGTSTWDTWIGNGQDKVELMSLDQSIIYGEDIGRIPIGHEVDILKVKRNSWNHNCLVLAKLKKAGIVYKVIIDPDNVEEILGLDFSSR